MPLDPNPDSIKLDDANRSSTPKRRGGVIGLYVAVVLLFVGLYFFKFDRPDVAQLGLVSLMVLPIWLILVGVPYLLSLALAIRGVIWAHGRRVQLIVSVAIALADCAGLWWLLHR